MLDQHNQNAQMIEELAEDEDYSSLASNNRVSQLMQMAEELSRASLVSIKLSREPTVTEYVPLSLVEDGTPKVFILPDSDENQMHPL